MSIVSLTQERMNLEPRLKSLRTEYKRRQAQAQWPNGPNDRMRAFVAAEEAARNEYDRKVMACEYVVSAMKELGVTPSVPSYLLACEEGARNTRNSTLGRLGDSYSSTREFISAYDKLRYEKVSMEKRMTLLDENIEIKKSSQKNF